MHSGIVKFFSKVNGYGFITTDIGIDLYVHIRDIKPALVNRLVTGQKVSFEIGVNYRNRPGVSNLQLDQSQNSMIDSPFNYPVAKSFYKPNLERLNALPVGSKLQWREASRALLTVLVRRLLSRGWKLYYSSGNKFNHRKESRYLYSGGRKRLKVRISNHEFPGPDGYKGDCNFIVTKNTIIQSKSIGQIINKIEGNLYSNVEGSIVL